jgi:vitamin B12/bleomycin/antimicrobial peptide transport system ATP-binding/permease protein
VSQLALGNVIDDGICELLETFGLLHPAELHQLDAFKNWKDLLSLGEQQRIAIIRLVLNLPAPATLDESTSAISESQQETFYCLLRSLVHFCRASSRAVWVS